jgi:hypothetical protein
MSRTERGRARQNSTEGRPCTNSSTSIQYSMPTLRVDAFPPILHSMLIGGRSRTLSTLSTPSVCNAFLPSTRHLRRQRDSPDGQVRNLPLSYSPPSHALSMPIPFGIGTCDTRILILLAKLTGIPSSIFILLILLASLVKVVTFGDTHPARQPSPASRADSYQEKISIYTR